MADTWPGGDLINGLLNAGNSWADECDDFRFTTRHSPKEKKHSPKPKDLEKEIRSLMVQSEIRHKETQKRLDETCQKLDELTRRFNAMTTTAAKTQKTSAIQHGPSFVDSSVRSFDHVFFLFDVDGAITQGENGNKENNTFWVVQFAGILFEMVLVDAPDDVPQKWSFKKRGFITRNIVLPPIREVGRTTLDQYDRAKNKTHRIQWTAHTKSKNDSDLHDAFEDLREFIGTVPADRLCFVCKNTDLEKRFISKVGLQGKYVDRRSAKKIIKEATDESEHAWLNIDGLVKSVPEGRTHVCLSDCEYFYDQLVDKKDAWVRFYAANRASLRN